MTDQPLPPEPGGGESPAGPGSGRKEPVKRVVLGNGETMVLAGYAQRLCARIADTFVFSIGFFLLWPVNFGAYSLVFSSRLEFTLSVLTTLFLPLINEAVAISWWGRTLGMKILGIRIVSKKTGKTPSVIASFFRWALQIILVLYSLRHNISELAGSAFALGWLLISIPWWLLVHLSVFWGRDRRGWHDLVAGTVVVADDPPEPAVSPGGDTG